MIDFVIVAAAFILAVNAVILFRSLLGEVRYRRAVRRRVKHYASLNDAIRDQRR